MKLALLQINPVVGDLEGNAAKIAAGVEKAGALGADLALTPELSLLGYPPKDLLLNLDFVRRAALVAKRLAADLAAGPPVLVGLAEENPTGPGKALFNSAALLRAGRLEKLFRKSLLPTYDVFDEDRYFEPGFGDRTFELKGLTLGLTICEDAWNDPDFWPHRRYRQDPPAEACGQGADLLLNLSASPFAVGKQTRREKMFSALAAKHRRPLVYLNTVGGNDDLIFEGRSSVFDPQGKLVARAAAFREDLLLVETDPLGGPLAEDDFAPESEAWRALVLGTRDYAAKCGFKEALLGLSGGIDSSLTAAVAAEALGPEHVLGVLMPSPHSSQGSIDDALALAENLGLKTLTLPIESITRAFEEALAPAFAGRAEDVTEENIQARTRGNLLMSISNKFGSLLLTTGNKSELAVGYCTLYGDMSGGLAVISDVPKTYVFRICRWLNQERGREVIPEAVLAKPPSAELRPDQKDEDSLPPYDLLDQVLELIIEEHLSGPEIAARGFDPELTAEIMGLVKRAEFKRRQAAPGLKITDQAFGSGWRMPLAARY